MQLSLQNIEQHISNAPFLRDDFHSKICELACLGAVATQMTTQEFFDLQKILGSGFSLEKAVLELPASSFKLAVKNDPKLFGEARMAVEDCEKKSFRIIYPGHALYPEGFLTIDHPPKLLTYVGEPAWLAPVRISVVGSREMSQNAKEWMEQYFDLYLKSSSAVTVSGAAFGIDQMAHRLSVRNCLPTIAFIPSGLSKVYPYRFNYDMKEILLAKGAVVSEFPPSFEMKKHHFERRNRLISAISDVLFVVEARRKSGSIMTARLALSQNKTICVLPSSPMNAQNLGNLDLLFDGAHPLRDDKDLMAVMGG